MSNKKGHFTEQELAILFATTAHKLVDTDLPLHEFIKANSEKFLAAAECAVNAREGILDELAKEIFGTDEAVSLHEQNTSVH